MVEFTLSDQEYTRFHDFLVEHCGIVLGANRHYLVSSRINAIRHRLSIDSMASLLSRLESGDLHLKSQVIDAMTTNETSWFRDRTPFEVLGGEILDDLAQRGVSGPRIWSAACSYGQEPYSISIVFDEYIRHNPSIFTRGDIVATDISRRVLDVARSGYYGQSSMVRGLDQGRIRYYFERVDSGFRVKPVIASRIQFREFNLQRDFAALGKFDCIFCRNVLIYFSATTRQLMIRKFFDQLNPGGYLLLGGAETPVGCEDQFTSCIANRYLYYRKSDLASDSLRPQSSKRVMLP